MFVGPLNPGADNKYYTALQNFGESHDFFRQLQTPDEKKEHYVASVAHRKY